MSLSHKQRNYGTKIEIPTTLHIKKWLKDNSGWMVLLVILVFIAYANSLTGEFLSDDVESILENKNLPYIHYIFSPPLRIVKSLITFLTFKIAGPNPFMFHLVNLVFHSATVVSVFVLIGLLANPVLAFFVAALMAVHPLLSEAVTWISAGVYVQYTCVAILSLISYLLINRDSKKFYLYSLVLYSISILIGPDKALIFPVILLSLELVNRDLQKNWKRLIPFFAVSIAVGLYYVFHGDITYRLHEPGVGTAGSIQNPFIQVPAALTSYWQLAVWPMALTFYHSELKFSVVEFTVRCAFTIAFFVLLVYTFNKNRPLFFWLSVFFISLWPTLTPLGVAWVVSERYVYFGSIGIFFVFGSIFYYFTRKEKTKTISYFCFAVVICALLVRTIVRNMDWQNKDSLSLATAIYSPSDPKTHNNLGDMYLRQGQYPQAIKEFSTAIRLDPQYADGYHNLATVYANLGTYDLAILNYKKALQINPNLWQSYQAMGTIMFRQNQYDQALLNYEKALRINPEAVSIHIDMGVLYLKTGNKEKALETFNTILRLEPGNGTGLLGIEEANKLP